MSESTSMRKMLGLLRGAGGAITLAGAAFLVVAGVGAATYRPDAPAPATRTTVHAEADSDTVANLKEYARSIGVAGLPPAAAPAEPLPDVTTLIGRLAARLEKSPDDAKGWRMLGWSYFHMGRYADAAAALAKAVALDPTSAELKTLHAEAKAKASGSDKAQAATPHAHGDAGAVARGPSAEQMKAAESMSPHDRQASIRAMVDGLADRLEASPRDVDGWTRLMRSRVVLGETEVAVTALRKALDVFKDDPAATGRIDAAAAELGLKPQ
jgi:tetratricopeptide (TPR) repeat protein